MSNGDDQRRDDPSAEAAIALARELYGLADAINGDGGGTQDRSIDRVALEPRRRCRADGTVIPDLVLYVTRPLIVDDAERLRAVIDELSDIAVYATRREQLRVAQILNDTINVIRERSAGTRIDDAADAPQRAACIP